MAVVGAGTGFGKSIIYYNKDVNAFFPIPSEGGHADLPLLNKKELSLAEHIKKEKNIRFNLRYEDVLSGKGLENIYRFRYFWSNIKKTKRTILNKL